MSFLSFPRRRESDNIKTVMIDVKLEILQNRLNKIQFFLSRTTEAFDDWEYNGDELFVILKNKIIE